MVFRLFIIALLLISSCACEAGPVRLQNSRLVVTVEPDRGFISVRDMRARRDWIQQGGAKHYAFSKVEKTSDSISFTTTCENRTFSFNTWKWSEYAPRECRITLSLPKAHPEQLVITYDMPKGMPVHGIQGLEPFAPPQTEDAEDSVLAVTDWSSGHLWPTNLPNWPFQWLEYYPVSMLQLPWVAVCDLKSAAGYSMTVDTPCDAMLRCIDLDPGDGVRRAPLITWLGELGKWGYARRVIYTFADAGGYAGLAKSYREYVIENPYGATPQGLVTLDKKAARNPNIRKLYGATYIRDYFHYTDAVEASTLGIERAFHHVWHWGHGTNTGQGKDDAATLETERKLGWLTEEYETFADSYVVDDAKKIDWVHDLRKNLISDPKGELVKGWVDKNGQQFQRCSSVFMDRVKAADVERLRPYPTTGRYIDVHPQIDFRECYDPAHPRSRRQFLADSIGLMDYQHNGIVIDGKKMPMVIHGECGRWWSVPYQDITMGHLSILNMPWDRAPKSYRQITDKFKESNWDNYEKYGTVGHRYQAPLWQLVFHDCIVDKFREDNDATDCTTAAELSDPKWPWSYQKNKDALAVLYGGVASFFNVASDDSWFAGDESRCRFLASYRNTCKPQEVLADKEMVTHEFVTPDRLVQKTTWSDGTVIVVNFGPSTFEARLGGEFYRLPQFGLVVKGPKVEASMVGDSDSRLTRIRMDGYWFSDEGGKPVTVRRISDRLVRANFDYNGKGPVEFDVPVRRVVKDWNLNKTRVWQCDPKTGKRLGQMKWTLSTEGTIIIGPVSDWTVLDVELG